MRDNAVGRASLGVLLVLGASCGEQPPRAPPVRAAYRMPLPAPPPPPPSPEEARAMTSVLRHQLAATPPVPVPLDVPCTGEAFVPSAQVGTEDQGIPRFHGWELDDVAPLGESRTRELIDLLNDPAAYEVSCTLCSGPPILVRICCGEWTGDFHIDPSDSISRLWSSGEPPLDHLALSHVGRTAVRKWLEGALPDGSFGCPEDDGDSAEK